MELPNWLKLWHKDEEPAWKTMPVGLTLEAAHFVNDILKKEGNPASLGGTVIALRLIEKAARDEFGPILESPEINPLCIAALEHLMEKGALNLSATNIIRAYEEHKEAQD